jgi:DNA-binding NarL/FixJ family response regulator
MAVPTAALGLGNWRCRAGGRSNHREAAHPGSEAARAVEAADPPAVFVASARLHQPARGRDAFHIADGREMTGCVAKFGCPKFGCRRRMPEFAHEACQSPSGNREAAWVLLSLFTDFVGELTVYGPASRQDGTPQGRMGGRGLSVRRMAEAPKKILCIEDDRETAKLIAEELSERRFEVLIAYEGSQGFIAILKGIPDLVLCDIGLPHMSGFEILERLNELAPRLEHIPFVFLTALADRDNELRGRDLGADDYITKPVDFDILETIINARLAGVARNEIWPTLVNLNAREAETLTWVARGKTSAQIAEMLEMPKRTVEFHLDNARAKLRASTRTEAALKATMGRLIKP